MELTIEATDKLRADIVAAASKHLDNVRVFNFEQSLYNSDTDNFTIGISCRVWAEDLPTVKIEHFADWKQAIKARWFPEWAQREYPIKYTKHIVKVMIIYPKLKYNSPDCDMRRIARHPESVITLGSDITSDEFDDIKARVTASYQQEQGRTKTVRTGEPVVCKEITLRKEQFGLNLRVSKRELLADNLADTIALHLQKSMYLPSPPITITYPNHWTQWLLQVAKKTGLAPLLRNVPVVTITHNFSVESVMEGIKPSLDEEAVFRVFVAGVVEVEKVGGDEVKAM